MSAQGGSTVVITARTLAPAGLELLEREGCRAVFVTDGTVQSLLDAVRSQRADAILCRGSCPAEVIRAAKHLKVISRHGVGYDAVDVATASALGIPVLIAQGASAQSVAELTFALLGSVARQLNNHTQRIREARWERTGAGVQLGGKTLGIVGLGNIGSKVARIGQAMGMNVIAYDIRDRRDVVPGVTMVDALEALLAQSHIVSLHTPRTELTAGMMGAPQFARMRAGAIFINTSRGEVVNELALHDALASGHLWGAGFDVHQHELPQPYNPLRSLPNVVMTPHVGAQTDVALEQVAVAAVQNIVDVLRGRALNPDTCVNFQGLARPAANTQ
jgi:D-3-phosphoglycerate dehydrogenase / 2-oxoglutarate reductase